MEVPGDKEAFRGLTITTGGSASSVSLIQQWDTMGVNFIHQYGLNETHGPYVVCEEQEEWQALPPESRALKRTRQGVPTIHAGTGLRVVDTFRRDVPRNGQTLGEVIVAGNTVATGYYRDPEATKKAFRDGWFHTGDMAVIHPDGYLEIRDRLKDLIYVETDYGWENISSIEIENVLCQHEQVRDASVIGISPEDLGKNRTLLVAFIEARDGKPTLLEDLQHFCQAQLASYKQPQVFFFTDLPKTATGKVRKDLLVKEALTRLASNTGSWQLLVILVGVRQKAEGSPNETSFTAKHEKVFSPCSLLPAPCSLLPLSSQKAEGKKEGKFPKFLWDKSFKTSAFCLLPSALKPFSVLITKIGQEPQYGSL